MAERASQRVALDKRRRKAESARKEAVRLRDKAKGGKTRDKHAKIVTDREEEIKLIDAELAELDE